MIAKQILAYQLPQGGLVNIYSQNNVLGMYPEHLTILFGENQYIIAKHLQDILVEEELVAVNHIQMQPETFYSLDIVISLAYRLRSKRALLFRNWVNNILKTRLLDEDMRKQQNAESAPISKVLTDYAFALDILDQYDHQVLKTPHSKSPELFLVNYQEAMSAIDSLREKFGGSSLFGNEKDQSFKGSLAAIYQTFDGEYLYAGIEEKAAILLYFIVKNHSFSDGNKRIAAFLFVWFLDKNAILYKQNGSRRINNSTLVAITLMIAESKPDEKEMIVKVIVNLISKENQID
ncbi:Fic family protein [uncultured Chitinophaga sp.]|uniref:Fic family protein n=1 Tax=uncultured Chitinophaga sp. TaxID=339340 RepID=UPI0025F8245C|nr:Fic family protein [uncultured Chitinophaga sp.]